MTPTAKPHSSKTPVRLYLVAALSVAGMILSGVLTHQYYQIREGTAGFRTFCNFGQTMNCDAVAASSYAELFAGLPLSSFAAGWYLALLVVTLMAIPRDWRREGIRGAFALTAVATLLSIVYFFIMASVIKTFCLFCLILDGINLAALGLLLSLRPESPKRAPLEWAKWKTVIWVTLGSLVVALVMLKQLEGRPVDRTTVMQTADSVLSGTPVSIAVSDDQPVLGAKNAPVTIVEFSDFQCPYCRVGAVMVNTVLNRFPGQVRVVLKNYPLDMACNPALTRAMHTAACESAKTTYCAGKQGKFAEVYESLFEHQATLRPGRPVELAKEAGLNADQLAACMDHPDTGVAIAKDIQDGNSVGVNSTPTFFLNGYRVEGVYPLPVWVEVIERLLRQPRTGSR